MQATAGSLGSGSMVTSVVSGSETGRVVLVPLLDKEDDEERPAPPPPAAAWAGPVRSPSIPAPAFATESASSFSLASVKTIPPALAPAVSQPTPPANSLKLPPLPAVPEAALSASTSSLPGAPSLPAAASAPPSPLSNAASVAVAPRPAIDDRTIRVFLSSTFNDMKDERNEIFRSTFPRIQRLCAARGLHLVFVDLRWGISEEDAKQGQVILTCLRELLRSTYFVNFLKRRYGWHADPARPDPLLDLSFEQAAKEFPHVRRYKDRSVTELEVISAAMDDAASTHKPEGTAAFFFASEELFAGEPAESPHAEAAMRRLKADIRERRPAAVLPPYTSAANLSNAIHDFLVAAVERDFPRRAARSWLEEERALQDAHMHALRTVYVRRSAAHEALDAYVAASGPELFLLTAPSGYGKSAVMASWVQEYAAVHARDANLALVTHFIGGSEGSANLRGLVRRLHDEVREALAPWSPVKMKDVDSIPDETDLLIRFAEWLAGAPASAQAAAVSASQGGGSKKGPEAFARLETPRETPRQTPRGVKGLLGPLLAMRQMMGPHAIAKWRPRLVVVIDALDHLDSTRTAARRLAYLPTEAGPQLRLVLAAGPSESAEAARARPHTELLLPPLLEREKQELARKDLRTVGKALDAAQMGRVLASEQCGVPLYLKAVLQELKASAVFETLAGLLEQCLACGTPEQLCELTIRRWMTQYEEAAPALRAALCCLLVSRFGLAENELQAIAGAAGGEPGQAAGDGRASPEPPREGPAAVSALAWSEALAAVLPALSNRGGVLNFAQRPMAEAVRAMFGLGEEAGRRPHHDRLARFFGGQPASDRRAVELPFHLLRAGRETQLPKVLTDLDLLHRRRKDLHEVASLWRATGYKDAQIQELYKEAIADWEYEMIAQGGLPKAAPAPGEEGGLAAPPLPSFGLSLKAEKLQERLNVQSRLAALLQDVGGLLRALGAFSHATGFFRRSLETLEEMSRLLPLLQKTSSKARRRWQMPAVLAIAVSPPKEGEEEEEEEGGTALEDELESAAELAAQLEERLSAATHNLAALEQDLGRFGQALPLYEKCLKMDAALAGYPNWDWREEAAGEAEGAAGPEGSKKALSSSSYAGVRLGADAIATMVNLGDLYRCTQAFDDACALLDRALLLATREFGENHPSCAAALSALANVYSDMGDHREALELHGRVNRIYELAYGSEHPQTAAALNNQALAYEKLGEPAEAERLFRRCLSIRERANGADHVSCAGVLNNLGELLRKQKKAAEAGDMFRRSLRIREQAYGPQHQAVSTALNNLAALLEEEGDLQQALPMLQRSLAIRRGAFGERHGTVATALNNVAEVMTKLGQAEAATPLYEEALDIAEEVYGGGDPAEPGGAMTSRAKSYRRMKSSRTARSARSARSEDGEGSGKSPAKSPAPEEPANPIVGNIAANFARNLEARGKADRAIEVYGRALDVLVRAYGEEHPSVGLVCGSLALLHDSREEQAVAIPYYRRALRALEAAHGAEAPETAVPLHALAALYLTVEGPDLGPENEGRTQGDVAEGLLRRCLAIRERALGPAHADTKDTASWLANVLQARGEEGAAAAMREKYGIEEEGEGGGGEAQDGA